MPGAGSVHKLEKIFIRTNGLLNIIISICVAPTALE